METIEKYLTSLDLSQVPILLGQNIYMIFSKTIQADVNDQVFEANSFSLSLDIGFFCFQTYWINKNSYDYYQLKLSRLPDPLGIQRSKDHALVDPSSIIIAPASKVKSIELYSDQSEWDNGGRELIRVKYDSAFLFKQEDGNSFLIGVAETIADLTQFIRDDKAIDSRLDGLVKRLEWN